MKGDKAGSRKLNLTSRAGARKSGKQRRKFIKAPRIQRLMRKGVDQDHISSSPIKLLELLREGPLLYHYYTTIFSCSILFFLFFYIPFLSFIFFCI